MPEYSSPYRQQAIERTAIQTIEQVAMDIGGVNAAAGSGTHLADEAPPSQIRRWTQRIPNNIKVLRLIEEGRHAPSEVKGALDRELHEALTAYNDAQRAYLEEARKPVDPTNVRITTDLDPSYVERFRFDNPISEFYRLNDMINASFYTLANLDALPEPAVAQEWITTKFLPGLDHFFNPSMHTWIMYQYALSPQYQDRPGYAELRASIEATGLRQTYVRQSRWNAGWSIHDPMLARGRVDASDIPSIEVLGIPAGYQIKPEAYQEIREFFLAINP
jgi:hypothetical protein